MIQVRGPDGAIVQFPDGTPPAVMQDALARHYGGHGTRQDFRAPNAGPVPDAQHNPVLAPMLGPQQHPKSEDWWRSLMGGLTQGGNAITAPLGSVRQLGDAANDWLAQQQENLGLAPKGTNAALKKAGLSPHALMDAATDPVGAIQHAIAKPVIERGLSQAGAHPQLAHATASMMTAPGSPVPGLPAWSPSDVRNFEGGVADQVAGVQGKQAVADVADYQPQTALGRGLHTVGQFAPAAIAPGTAVQRAAAVAIPAATSDAAGEIAHNVAPDYEDAARFVGGLGGGFLAGAATSPGMTTRSLAEGAGNASPEELAQALGLMKWADSKGFNLSTPEALDYVTGGRTNLTRDLNFIESTRKGGQLFGDYYGPRPGQMRDAAFGVFDQIAPPADSPTALGLRAQDAANGVLDLARQRVNESASPVYQRLPGQSVDLTPLSGNEAYAQGLRDFRSTPILNNRPVAEGQPTTYAQLPDNDAAVVNEVSKRLGDLGEGAAQNSDRTIASQYGKAKDLADALATASTPDYGLARETVSTGHRAFVDPLKNGGTGKIAAPQNEATQVRALYPSNPAESTAGDTALTLQLLKLKDPTVGPALTRQYLSGAYDAAAPDIGAAAVPDQLGASKFARSVAGSQFDRDTLMAGVNATAPNAVSDVSNLIDALAATGTRRLPGRGEVPMMMDKNAWENAPGVLSAGGRALSGGAGILEHGVRPWWDRAQLNMGSKDYFDAVTQGSPDERIQRLADALSAYQPTPPLSMRALVLSAPQLQDQGSQ